jgi:hypothetical protein
MAFSSTITKKEIFGGQRVVMGTLAQISGDTGGVIQTGLRKVNHFNASVHCVSVTIAGGAVTIVTADPVAAQPGFWMAIGE